MSTSTTKRAAKNTVIIYFRMFFLMCISFVASRLLLKTLGIEDYGIYSVVGSVTSTFVAIKSLFSESIQRFLNFYKGKEDLTTQKEVFSLGILIHVFLAILFVIVLEVVGLWLINNKLSYPIEKYDTVIFVFQMTVIASAISIWTIPFDAVIIANEKMGVYALISIIDGILRLVGVVLLPIIPYPSLKAYSLFLVFIPLNQLLISAFYCRKFEECKYVRPRNRMLFKDLMSLSGWNFFGNITFSLLHEGINFILNIFGGLVYNVARSIAYQVKGITAQFSNNSMIAVRPIVMQSAAKDDGNQILFSNIIKISRVAVFLVLIPIVTIEAFCPELLDIWLAEVPPYSVSYTRLVLLGILFRSLHEPINMLYMSLGRIKRMILSEALVMLFFLTIIYMALSNGMPLWTSFALLAVMEIVIIIVLLINAQLELGFPVLRYCKEVILPFVYILLINLVLAYLYSIIHPRGIIITLSLCASLLLLTCLSIYMFMNEKEKELLRAFAAKKLHLKAKE